MVRFSLLAVAGHTVAALRSDLTWALLITNSTAQFRGLAAVSDDVAWVAGSKATVLRTTDAGATWQSVGPPPEIAPIELQYRDVAAFSADHALILSIGEGNQSRVYATSDGGTTWAQTFVNEDPAGFYDCLAFTPDGQHGLTLGDPIDGRFQILESTNGGNSWDLLDLAKDNAMPLAKSGEAAFAASGTCLTMAPGNRAYVATGGVDPGRVFRSADGGHTWQVAGTPLAGGEGSGVFSVQFRDEKHGIIVGGDYTVPNKTGANAAWSNDGGETWKPSTVFPAGYRSGAAWVPQTCGVALAVGPTGSDLTTDAGRTWETFHNGSFDSVECSSRKVCWASGQGGRVARLVLG